jgi:hypothetical protein
VGNAGTASGAAGSGGEVGGTSSQGGSLGEGGTDGMEGGAPPSLEALPGELRRLTAREYAATVTDVLGTTQVPELDDFTVVVDGFDNNALGNGVSDALYQRYLETAEDLADEVFDSSTLRARIVTCTQTDVTPCIEEIVEGAGLRLFRRPLTSAEVSAYTKVYQRARARELDHAEAARDVLVALLASAQFVFRMELAPQDAGEQPLGGYDVASRLSYLLWSSAPDDELLQEADADELATDDQLAAAVDRLLADPRSSRFVGAFAGQWLGAETLGDLEFGPLVYPEWTDQLATAASAEMSAFFGELLHDDLPWSTFLNSRAHFVNQTLGNLYGLKVQGTELRRVELNGVDRRGFLGLVGFLAQTSASTRTSPSRRGYYVAQRLLCQHLPGPPDNMPAYTGNEDGVPAYLAGLQPACRNCHQRFDAYGLTLQHYDTLGAYRSSYASGAAIATEVALPTEDAPTVDGVSELSDVLAALPDFTRCPPEKLYTYGFGRAFSEGERGNVDALAKRWERGPQTMRRLILELVQSKAFRFRNDGGAP